jgi:hypothetical protein
MLRFNRIKALVLVGVALLLLGMGAGCGNPGRIVFRADSPASPLEDAR